MDPSWGFARPILGLFLTLYFPFDINDNIFQQQDPTILLNDRHASVYYQPKEN